MDLQAHVVDVMGEIVGQVRVLGVVPYLFDGVELGGVGRQPFDRGPAGASFKQAADRGPMNIPSIENQHDLALQVTTEPPEKGQDVVGADVLIVDLKVKPQAFALGRDGEGRDGRKTVMSVPTLVDGGVSSGSPRAAEHRLKHKAAFVNKDDATAAPSSVFLYGATAPCTTAGPPSRRIPARDARASGSSNPSRGGRARHAPDGNARRNASGSTLPHAATSKGRCDTHVPEGPVAAASPVAGAPLQKASAFSRDGALLSNPPLRLPRKRFSIGLPSLAPHPHAEQPPLHAAPSPASLSLAFDAPPTPPSFLWVSYLMTSAPVRRFFTHYRAQ